MKNILIFKIWRHKLPALAAIVTMVVIFLWPSIPLKGISNWLRFFYYYTPQNYLYIIMTIFAGIYVGIYTYNRKVARCCSVQNTKVSSVGSFLGVILGACPACIPLLPLFFPLSVTVLLSSISWIFIVVSILFLSFAIWKMNGLKKNPYL